MMQMQVLIDLRKICVEVENELILKVFALLHPSRKSETRILDPSKDACSSNCLVLSLAVLSCVLDFREV